MNNINYFENTENTKSKERLTAYARKMQELQGNKRQSEQKKGK